MRAYLLGSFSVARQSSRGPSIARGTCSGRRPVGRMACDRAKDGSPVRGSWRWRTRRPPPPVACRNSSTSALGDGGPRGTLERPGLRVFNICALTISSPVRTKGKSAMTRTSFPDRSAQGQDPLSRWVSSTLGRARRKARVNADLGRRVHCARDYRRRPPPVLRYGQRALREVHESHRPVGD
jgi:hypothetical protein